MTSFRNLPIRQKLMLAIVGTSSMAVLLASIIFMTYELVSARSQMAHDLQTLTLIIGSNSTAALSFNDATAAEETLAALKARPLIQLACIYTDAHAQAEELFATYRNNATKTACPRLPPALGVIFTERNLTVTTPVKLGGEIIGTLFIQRSLNDLWYTTALYLGIVVGVLLVCMLVAFGMAALLQRFIAEPILELAETASQVSKSKDYSIRAHKHSSDEVGQLIDGFNDMLRQISQRNRALESTKTELVARVEETARANAELQSALVRLQVTQDQLVQKEKMASLGGLVAGISHEINTPIGVGVTAASTLSANATTLREDVEADNLTKSGLIRFTEMAVQATDIILANLNRASELIQSFKQVAVDQSSSERRRFKVNAYLHEVLLSLRPKLKKTRLHVAVNCDEALEINTFPGALAQVLTNLVMNSLTHAYDEGARGTLTIDVKQDNDWLRLKYSDDGKGIPRENLPRVFDPFFTTRRGSGGSGLGMHIVYNLVTQQLGGTVKLHSEPGIGTTVEILVPSNGVMDHEQSERRHG